MLNTVHVQVLERDPQRAVDVYCRAEDAPKELGAAAAAAAAGACARLAAYRTPLAWGAVSLTVRHAVYGGGPCH